MRNASLAPFFWALFSAGGTVSAFLFPIHLLLIGLAFPLGWLAAPSYDAMLGLIRHPLARLYIFVLVALPLFHWAHRFRYTLYDGLQLKHLTVPIVAFCYGTAVAGTVLAAYLLLTLP
ncbi:MAG: fumarate reductase subunit FrdD [Candidatus Methylomirabilales bacterium]